MLDNSSPLSDQAHPSGAGDLNAGARESPGSRSRAPAGCRRIALVIDSSGSMRGWKLALARKMVCGAGYRLDSDDRLCLVSFAARARLLLPLQAAPAPEAVERLVRGIRARGPSNLAGGVLCAIEQLDKQRHPGDTGLILLLGDGKANRGLSHRSRLLPLLAPGVNARISAFGLGEDCNLGLLGALAGCGRGRCYHLPVAADPSRLLDAELGLVRPRRAPRARMLRPARSGRETGFYNSLLWSKRRPGVTELEATIDLTDPGAVNDLARRLLKRMRARGLGRPLGRCARMLLQEQGKRIRALDSGAPLLLSVVCEVAPLYARVTTWHPTPWLTRDEVERLERAATAASGVHPRSVAGGRGPTLSAAMMDGGRRLEAVIRGAAAEAIASRQRDPPVVFHREVATVDIDLELDSYYASVVQSVFDELMEAGWIRFVLDLRHSTYFEEAILGCLIRALGLTTGYGGDITLVAPDAGMLWGMDLLGIRDLFEMTGSA